MTTMSLDKKPISIKKKAGLEKIEKILGPITRATLENYANAYPEVCDLIMEVVYGDIYQRNILSDKIKEIIAVSSLVTQGKLGVTLKSHIVGMMNTGSSKHEIIEVFLFLIPFVGFPTVIDALLEVHDILQSI